MKIPIEANEIRADRNLKESSFMIAAIHSLSSSAVAQEAPTSQVSSQPVAASKASSATSAPPASNDTVTISAAAQAMLKETRETPAQTAKEALAGDRQAQRLLAKEAAEHAS